MAAVINYRPLNKWSRGVAANMRPCQGRDRGFEPRRGRLEVIRVGQKPWND